MMPVYLIIAALAATALAKESIECRFGGSTGTHHCRGAEGNQLIFHLSNETNTELNLIKDEKYRILKRHSNGTITLDETYVSQFEQILNGKFKLGKATKRHTGEYLLEEYRSDGKLMKKVEVYLTIHGATFVTVAVRAVVVVLLLLLTVFLSVKLLKKKTTPMAEEDDAQDEVLYSEVIVTQAQ